MSKMFYTVEEATAKLGTSEEGLKDMVRSGKLREFRDAGSFNYKVDEVDKLAKETAPASNPSGASASGEIILEPVEDSSIELAPSGSDVIPLDASDFTDTVSGTASGGTVGGTAGGTREGTSAIERAKGDTAVPSVGVNVFDDEDLDEHVDPLAQTAVTDVAGLGLDGAGSGSGILDLTRESDDTSLGQELLDQIYSDGDITEAEDKADAGEATRAGLEVADGEEEVEDEEAPSKAEDVAPVVQPVAVEYGPDAVSTGLTALMAVAIVALLFSGLAAASLVRGITPSLVNMIYAKLWMFAVGIVVVAGTAAGLSYMVMKKKSG